MSTRALITIKHSKDKFETIYLHYDGYPDHAGNILRTQYNTIDSIKELMNLGDLSVIDASPECPPTHCFETPVSGYCVAYARDRGEESDSEVTTTVPCLDGVDYGYVFSDGTWTVRVA